MTVERDDDWAPDTNARRAWEFLFGTNRQFGLFYTEDEDYVNTQAGRQLSDDDEIVFDCPEDRYGAW